MGENKDIGKAFEERLSNYKVAPNDLVWENIVAQLDKKKKKKKPLIIWWKIAGIAAAILLLFGIRQKLNITKNQNKTIITNNDVQNKNSKDLNSNLTDSTKVIPEKQNKVIDAITISKTEQNNSTETANKNTEFVVKNNKTKINSNQIDTNNATNKLQKNNVKSTVISEKIVAKTTIDSNKNDATIIENKDKITKNIKDKNNVLNLLDSIKSKNNTLANKSKKADLNTEISKTNEVNINKKRNNKWEISLKAAPIFYNSLSNGSSLGTNINIDSKNNEITLSYGLSASYIINEKLKIRTGLHKVNLANQTNNIDSNTLLNSSTISFNNLDSFNTIEIGSLFPDENLFNIQQEISYLEIPFELKYSLFRKKVGLDLISGFSTLILNNNTVLIDDTNFGSVKNLKNISFSGNIGLGFDIKINDKINFNVEPLLKIQLNPYKDNTSNKPYFLGVYSGFSYRF